MPVCKASSMAKEATVLLAASYSLALARVRHAACTGAECTRSPRSHTDASAQAANNRTRHCTNASPHVPRSRAQ
eukprot:15115912-Alexandrium_andersonii.AAC.1